MANYIDRYASFRFNGGMRTTPGLVIKPLISDKTVLFKLGSTRLDKLSNDYYNTPFCGWLIMLANPEFGGLEFKIPDLSIIRVPYPFESAMERYNQSIQRHKQLYGE